MNHCSAVPRRRYWYPVQRSTTSLSRSRWTRSTSRPRASQRWARGAAAIAARCRPPWQPKFGDRNTPGLRRRSGVLGPTGLKRCEVQGSVQGAQQLRLPSGARDVDGEQAAGAEHGELDLVLDAEAPCLAQDVAGLVAGLAAGGRGVLGVGQGGEAAGRPLEPVHQLGGPLGVRRGRHQVELRGGDSSAQLLHPHRQRRPARCPGEVDVHLLHRGAVGTAGTPLLQGGAGGPVLGSGVLVDDAPVVPAH